MSDLTIIGGNLPTAQHPDRMYLGMMEPDAEDISHLVHRTRQAVEIRAKGLSETAALPLYTQFYPLSFDKYISYQREFRVLERELKSQGRLTSVRDTAPLRGFLQLHLRPEFTADLQGYVAYLKARNPGLVARIDSLARPSALPEEGRQEHTLIVAPSKWGKSELIKTLAYHYAEHEGRAAVIVLDPGGDMVKEMAMWPELVRSGRAILIEPGLRPGKTVGFNLLDGEGLNDENERGLVASFWAHQLGALTRETTSQMEELARNCVHVLLAYPGGATFRDMALLLSATAKGEMKPRQREVLRFAQRYPVERIADFFVNDFPAPFFDSTRRGLKSRINWLLSLPYAEAMFCGTNNFRLGQAIEERKFILVNLAKFEDQGARAVGKMLVALVGAIARKRNVQAIEDRTPTHLFVDEASSLVSDDLMKNLKELRKFRLYSTLAQQVEGDGFSKEYRRLLVDLTACKFVGSRAGDPGNLLDSDVELAGLHHREFWVQWPGQDGARRLQVRSDLAGTRHTVSNEEWWSYVEELIDRYYIDAPEYAPAQGAATEYVSEDVSLTDDDEPLPALDPGDPDHPEDLKGRAVQVPKPTAGRRKPPRRK